MSQAADSAAGRLVRAIGDHYSLGLEQGRLFRDGEPGLEMTRTLEILDRFLPANPARVLDVGGAAGAYSVALSERGYEVHLIDIFPDHVRQAQEAAVRGGFGFTASVGDARDLEVDDKSYDAVLLLGPLYHLVDRQDRLRALGETRRVLRQGGVLVAAAINRYRTLLARLYDGDPRDPTFAQIVELGIQTGRHHNPDPIGQPRRFTTAYLHRPDELATEVADSGLALETILAVEGPGWLIEDRWGDQEQRSSMLEVARTTETEPSLLGMSTHIAAVARRPFE